MEQGICFGLIWGNKVYLYKISWTLVKHIEFNWRDQRSIYPPGRHQENQEINHKSSVLPNKANVLQKGKDAQLLY